MLTTFQQQVRTATQALIDPRLLDTRISWLQTGSDHIIHLHDECPRSRVAQTATRKRKTMSILDAAKAKHCLSCTRIDDIGYAFGVASGYVHTVNQTIKNGQKILRTKTWANQPEKLGGAYEDACRNLRSMNNNDWNVDINEYIKPEILTSLQKRLQTIVTDIPKTASEVRDILANHAIVRICVDRGDSGSRYALDGQNRGAHDAHEAWCAMRSSGAESAKVAAVSAMTARLVEDKNTLDRGHKFLNKMIPKWEATYQKIVKGNKTLLVGITVDMDGLENDEICGTLLSFPHVGTGMTADWDDGAKTLLLLPETIGSLLKTSRINTDKPVESVVVQDNFNPEMLTLIMALWEPREPHNAYYRLGNALRAVQSI